MPPAKLTLGDRTFWVVPAHDVERWDDALAEARLRACIDGWTTRDVVLRLSAELGGPDDDIERALAHVARSLARGELVAVRLPDVAGDVDSSLLGIGDDTAARWEDLPSLSDLLPTRPESPSEPPRGEPGGPSEPSSPLRDDVHHFVAFVVRDVDGAALRGSWSCAVDGRDETGALGDAEARIVEVDAVASLSFRPQGYLAASRPAFAPGDACTALADGDHEVDVADEIGPVSLHLDRTTTIVVRVPKATVFTVPAYDLDLEVFRPGWLWLDEADRHGISGIGCIAQALAYARAHPERHVLVVGHTDTTGTKSHNRGVAERRASHLAALLRADVEAWVASCTADGTLVDLAAHMQWAARRFGWPCDAGLVAKSTPAFRSALATWREQGAAPTGIHVDRDAEPSADDWRLAYALLDLALAEELDVDLAELAALRSGLRWAEPAIVGAGELWPRALVGKNGVASAVNRRTEILFATTERIPGGAGDPAGSSIYGEDAWLWLDYIDPEPRAVLPLALVSQEGHAVFDTPFKVITAAGRVRYGRLDANGEAWVEDIAAGAFHVHWIDPDDVTTKIWAMRCEAALRDRDMPTLQRMFDRVPSLVQAVSQAWSVRFGDGAPDGLACAARELVVATPDALVIDYLLCEAGLQDAAVYEPASADGGKS